MGTRHTWKKGGHFTACTCNNLQLVCLCFTALLAVSYRYLVQLFGPNSSLTLPSLRQRLKVSQLLKNWQKSDYHLWTVTITLLSCKSYVWSEKGEEKILTLQWSSLVKQSALCSFFLSFFLCFCPFVRHPIVYLCRRTTAKSHKKDNELKMWVICVVGFEQ